MYYDQHMHTHHSPDSTERFEKYLALSDKPIVTTEHLDFFSPSQNKSDHIPDFAAYEKEIERLNARYGNRILKGLEVGFRKEDEKAILNFLDEKELDLMLLSIHHNGRYNFMKVGNDDVPLDRTLEEYYSMMLEGVRSFPQANVLAHFDYGLRRYDVSIEELQTVERKLKRIFEEMIRHDIAFELNTSSMYKHNNVHLYEYAIVLYQSVGGKLFTVGSDAHKAEDYEAHFDKAFDLLKRQGVQKLAVFKNLEYRLVPVP